MLNHTIELVVDFNRACPNTKWQENASSQQASSVPIAASREGYNHYSCIFDNKLEQISLFSLANSIINSYLSSVRENFIKIINSLEQISLFPFLTASLIHDCSCCTHISTILSSVKRIHHFQKNCWEQLYKERTNTSVSDWNPSLCVYQYIIKPHCN